ncbi:MAG: SpoIIE family protein phosphatase [Planctomycetes bacterium]|nr:SpoIIE family protein phosphatase [Planctomycetota bacterium]
MPTVADYLNLQTIRRLQYAFSALAESPIEICTPQGMAYLEDHGTPAQWSSSLLADREHAGPAGLPDNSTDCLKMPVVVEDEVAGCIVVSRRGPAPQHGAGGDDPAWLLKLLQLMANVVGGLCRREGELRSRANELATLYNLTAEFSGQHELDVLLDKVAKTVVKVLKAKGCSIRLFSEDRSELAITAVANLSGEYLQKGPVRLAESMIDREVLETKQPVYIEDAGSDPRVLYPAEARREGIVSALCVPMYYKDESLGVIRVYMGEKYVFDWFEISLIRSIAGEAGAAIANARLYQESIKSAQIKRQMMIAREVQQRMMPRNPPVLPNLDIFAAYVPSQELSGDFYDFINLPPDNLGLAVCDVVGKGVGAALLTASIRGSLRAHAANLYEMSAVLDRVNRDLCADTKVNDFATMFYGVLNYRDLKFTYTNAGHLPPLLIRDGTARLLGVGGGVLGINPKAKYQHEWVALQAGDTIFMYTDGLSDAMNFAYEPFGRERVEKTAVYAAGQNWPAERIFRHVRWAMRNFTGLNERYDDLTCVVIRILG